ncbi:MAG: hypothetical protein ACXIVO_09580 [Glycocaulis sp.]
MSEFKRWLLKPWPVQLIDVAGGFSIYPLIMISGFTRDYKIIAATILIVAVGAFFFLSKYKNETKLK